MYPSFFALAARNLTNSACLTLGNNLFAILFINGNFFCILLSIAIFCDGERSTYLSPCLPAILFLIKFLACLLALLVNISNVAIRFLLIFLARAILNLSLLILRPALLLCIRVMTLSFISSSDSTSLTTMSSKSCSVS